jgi:hypothetical protein
MRFYKLLPLLLLLPNAAHAFTFMANNMKGWSNTTVSFRLNPNACSVSQSALIAAIERAADLWNSVPTSKLKVQYGGLTSDTGLQAVPVVECDAAMGNTSTVGLGSIAVNSAGTILQGRVRLNSTSGSAGDIGTKTTTTLEIALTHEIGHVLGIGHTPSEEALMHFSIAQKTNLSLAQDDIDALTYLYPNKEPADGTVLGCGSLSGPDSSPWDGMAQWSLMLLVLAIGLALRLRQAF